MTLSASDKDEIKAFVKERDEMLLKLDIQAAKDFHKKYNPTISDAFEKADDELVLRSIHKARTAARSLPLEARKFSKDWLTMRGSSSMDDGDL